MARASAFVLIVSAGLAGCAGQGGTSMFYLEPHKLTELSCEDLKTRMDTAAKQLTKSQELREKAFRDPAGPLVSTMVYAPDYNKARFEHSTYREEAARRNCAGTPG